MAIVVILILEKSVLSYMYFATFIFNIPFICHGRIEKRGRYISKDSLFLVSLEKDESSQKVSHHQEGGPSGDFQVEEERIIWQFYYFLAGCLCTALVYLQIFVRPLQSHCAVESY